MSKTLDPIVVNPAKKLQTPTFFKRDIEKIVKQILAQQGGGSGGEGLEVIEWDGERNFTEEEFNKLAQNKACVAFVDGDYREYYYIVSIYVDYVDLCRFSVADDGIANGSASYLEINVDGSFEHFYYDFYELVNTNLYRHVISLSDDGDTKIIVTISNNGYNVTSESGIGQEIYNSISAFARTDVFEDLKACTLKSVTLLDCQFGSLGFAGPISDILDTVTQL